MLHHIIAIFAFLFPVCIHAQELPSTVLNDNRTYEVTASVSAKGTIVCAWAEARPNKAESNGIDLSVGYISSKDNGKTWTDKQLIDIPEMMTNVNPYLTSNDAGETFLVCMHVKQGNFAGNLSLYKFDPEKGNFELRSVVSESTSTLLDKPSMVAFGNEIHMVYVEYMPSGKNFVKYQVSKDKGMTWSNAESIFPDEKVMVLGPAIALLKNNDIVISCGSYMHDVYILKRDGKKKLGFGPLIKIPKMTKQQILPVLTEMSSDGKEGLALVWQNNHGSNEVWTSNSQDGGDTWSDPFLVTTTGSMLSPLPGKNRDIDCIYSDYADKKYGVYYKKIGKNSVLVEKTLRTPSPQPEKADYMGAYQKLLSVGSELFAFWIDYSDGSKLRLTRLDK